MSSVLKHFYLHEKSKKSGVFSMLDVLSQVQNGVERVIAYTSRTLSKVELSYETTRKELLSTVFGLKQFCQYLTFRDSY